MTTKPGLRPVLRRLVRLTQDGGIEWDRHLAKASLTEGTEDIVESVYTMNYKGHHFRLYQARCRSYDCDEDRDSWDTTIRLETVDSHDHFLWCFPCSPRLRELLEAVLCQTANVDKMFSDILYDEQ